MTIDPELILRLASLGLLVVIAVWAGYGIWNGEPKEEWQHDPVYPISVRDGE